jgi:hypothetical protein
MNRQAMSFGFFLAAHLAEVSDRGMIVLANPRRAWAFRCAQYLTLAPSCNKYDEAGGTRP